MSAMTFGSFHSTTPRRAALRRASFTRSMPAVAVAVVPVNPPAAHARLNAAELQKRRKFALFSAIGVVALMHVAIISTLNKPIQVAPMAKKIPPMSMEIALPPIPQPEVHPKPLPQVAAAKPVRPAPPSVPVVQSVSETSEPTQDAVRVAVAAPVLAPVAPPPPEPVSEPRGYAGYLNNPSPVYPPSAQKFGLQGRVVLKIHVLADGKPDNVSVFRSSGYEVLDNAAIKAVTNWVFDPAKRGQTPIDGWVNVPINFKIS